MRLLVVAAAGRTRRLVVEQAIDRGYSVTAFARRPLPDGPHTMAVGEATEPVAVGAAVRDQDAVVVAVGTSAIVRLLAPVMTAAGSPGW